MSVIYAWRFMYLASCRSCPERHVTLHGCMKYVQHENPSLPATCAGFQSYLSTELGLEGPPPTGEHVSPHKQCTCGYYALWFPDELRVSGTTTGRIWMRVLALGPVVRHSHGIRMHRYVILDMCWPRRGYFLWGQMQDFDPMAEDEEIKEGRRVADVMEELTARFRCRLWREVPEEVAARLPGGIFDEPSAEDMGLLEAIAEGGEWDAGL